MCAFRDAAVATDDYWLAGYVKWWSVGGSDGQMHEPGVSADHSRPKRRTRNKPLC